MLERYRLQGFKSWNDSGEVRLAPITAFFGTNSSGKTSFLQSLLLLKQTTDSADRNRVLDLGSATSLVDLGTAKDIQHKHDNESSLSFDLAWAHPEIVNVADVSRQSGRGSNLFGSRQLRMSTKIDIGERGALDVTDLTYHMGNRSFTMGKRENRKGWELQSTDYSFVRTTGRPWPLPAPTRFYGFPDQVRQYYQNASFLSDLELAFEQACARIRYLGPLRDDPHRQYIFAGGAPADVGLRGELAIDALIAASLSGKRVSRGRASGSRGYRLPAIPIQRLIAEWLKELGLIDSFELEAIDQRETMYEVRVQKSRGSVPVMLTDVGFGISQVLPVLVLLAYAEEGDTIVLEQPEIHLHPAVQSGLADVIIESAIARNLQIIVESHSEHLLTRLQRRIAEVNVGKGLTLRPDDVALYFCELRNGASVARELNVDDFGNITNWPEDFFGDPLDDSVAMLEAAAARRGNNQ